MQSNTLNIGHKMEEKIAAQPHIPKELNLWLLKVAVSQDKQAFTHLFEFFAPKIKHFGMSKLGNEAMANELVQDTMTIIWKKASLFDDTKGAVTTWVYTIMRNTYFDTLRKMKHGKSLPLSEDIWPFEEETEHPNDDFKDHLLNEKILKCIDTLPLAQQSIIKGVYYQELTQEQLAKQLGIPLGTVKSRLRLALSKLKQQIGVNFHD